MTGAEAPAGALAGLRVLDLSRVLAGPLSAQVLGDLGADVVKVERPGRGDDSRSWAPPFLFDPPASPVDEAVYFWNCNRGKRSVIADIAEPSGQDLVRRLARGADVLVENYKVGALARYGLDYDTLAISNPRLIYCSITGFGQSGPYRNRPGYDTVVQAMGGMMSLTGEGGGAPLKAGLPAADTLTALYASTAILAAVHERSRSGKGQWIDLALLDVQVAMLGNIGMNYLATGKAPRRAGNRLTTVYPSDNFRCRDGEIMIIVGNDEQFRRLCVALDVPNLAEDPRFIHNESRLRHAEALGRLLSEAFERRSMAQCQASLDVARVPASPINDLAGVFADEQVVARRMVRELAGAGGRKIHVIANPIRMSRTPPNYEQVAPKLGEHTEEVVHDLWGIGQEVMQGGSEETD